MNKNFEQMLRLVDYVDGLMVVDKNCIIRHYYTAYPELVNLRQDEPLNRSLFEIYPSLKREDSYICRALETGESFINYEQTYINYKGDAMEANCSAVPIKEHGEVVGVIDMVIYKDAHVTERRLSFDISLISALTKSYNTSDQSLEDIVTQDGEMIRIKEKILQTADSDAHVLVYGKTGTGKELIVNAIQKTSRRKDAPFIKQNCASIPSTLLESILFGTTKGSYTGAKDTPGLFELADGGTLFLDEINSLPLALQGKFLRVLESHKSKRLGAVEEQEIDFRLLAATNQNLKEGVLAGTFRADLYYRLNVIPLELPPLRERREDIAPLATFFLDYYCKRYSRTKVLSRRVIEQLKAYDWPGNIRELKNVVERLLVTSAAGTLEIYQDLAPLLGEDAVRSTSPEIYPADWEAFYQFDPEHFSLKAYMEFCEKHVLADALKRCPSSYKAAALLKTDQSTIVRKRKKYGL